MRSWLSDNVVMLASAYEGSGRAVRLPPVHAQVYCFVDDVDSHFARARECGATVVGEPKNEPARASTGPSIPRGTRWIFAMPHAGDPNDLRRRRRWRTFATLAGPTRRRVGRALAARSPGAQGELAAAFG